MKTWPNERPNPWLALLIVLGIYAAVSYTYMQVVDLPWLFDQQLSQAGNLTEEQRNQAVEAATQLSPPQTNGGSPSGFGTHGKLQQSALEAHAWPT